MPIHVLIQRPYWLLLLCFSIGYIYYTLSSNQLSDVYVFHARKVSERAKQVMDFVNMTAFLKNKWNIGKLSERDIFFQNVTRSGDSYVFSAYLDDTKNFNKIRAIGIKDRTSGLNISCVVWFRGMSSAGYVTVPGYVNEHPEIFMRSWAQVHYMCPLDDRFPDPYAVSIVTDDHSEPLNFIRITYTARSELRNYTVCLHNAFNFRNDMSKQLVEWFELHRLLGADHFTIYNFSSHPNNDAVMKMYAKKGLLTLVQWDIPLHTDLIFLGQVAVMTDCLYRNFYSSKFITHLDLDEFIVPRRHDVNTVPELVSILPQVCAYIARCSVFSVATGQSDDSFIGQEIAQTYDMASLLIRQRQNFIYGSKDRSKIVYRTACIEAAGVHKVQSFSSGIVSESTLDPEDGLLHHYRHGRPKFVKRGETVRDDYMLKYAPYLVNNIRMVWEHNITAEIK